MADGSKTVVYAALAGNFLIAVTKFAAAFVTGSSAMLSEGVHSLVDTGNEVLLLYGMRRAEKPADRTHPLGHGRELYFWSFIVALLVFALGAGVSIYQGIHHMMDPEPIESPGWNYAVLGASFLFEGFSWVVALREFRRQKGSAGYIEAITRSKDPTTFTVLLEDSAALAGLVIAFAGIFLAERLGMPELDGLASIGIGLLLAGVAIFLARESKGLLIGEPALPAVQASILRIAEADPAIRKANGAITTHLGPRQIVVALSAEFEDHMTAPEIEACVQRIETRVRAEQPDVTTLFVKPQTAGTWAQRARSIADG
ncbi:cation diffusion facilitator family transporter [Aureimonas sp. AU22]|uniref:cation diffusion facilitator family transporter n=1 Tax=Aureimonas sp. AU22 TaxID=1638162 RepID=UPI0007860222|nr:cation diffusion facilitator family transporter [Aureimonas sp. AU22]